jgi:thioredoxin reductase (NADPH)
MVRNVTIIGSGPAGLTAAIYSARANLSPVVIEGTQAGGQLMLTTMVENYPAFPDGLLGPDLIKKSRMQAERFGAEFLSGDVTQVDLSNNPFKIFFDEEGQKPIETKTLIIASGASARLLGLPSEIKLMGHGTSTCAMEEAIFLTKFATRVSIIHRRDQLRASKIMQDRAKANSKISFVWNTVLQDILGEDVVRGVRIKNVKTGKVTEMACDGVFIAIGYDPNTKLFAGQIEMDEKGYIITRNGTETNVPGVFAAGDVQDHRYRQAITAAGSGCMASMDAEKYIENLD